MLFNIPSYSRVRFFFFFLFFFFRFSHSFSFKKVRFISQDNVRVTPINITLIHERLRIYLLIPTITTIVYVSLLFSWHAQHIRGQKTMPLRNSKKGMLRIHNQHGITCYVLKNCTKELLLREGNDASDSLLCFVIQNI